MTWRRRANKNVVEAVVDAFRDSAEGSAERLLALKCHEWRQSYHWLDASGLALYFLDRLESLHIERSLPAATLERLRGNRADNRDRSTSMFAEFASLNQSFEAAGLLYANLKGFTLSPESCPRPELRCQLDFDFLVDGTQLDRCHKLLSKRGYELTAAPPGVWEYKVGYSELTSIKDHYKARPQRSVEIHFASSKAPPYLPFRDSRLDRLSHRSWGGITFPALMAADQLIFQALHVFKHLCSSCTRLSWLLEYQHHVSVRYRDQIFWDQVCKLAEARPQAPIAIALTTLLSLRLFGGETPPRLEEWCSARLPRPVKLWADQYGREAVLADFPGTKLYLLLQEVLDVNDISWKKTKRSTLLPLHPAPRILFTGCDDSTWKRIRNEAYQLRFTLFRLRFHIVEGLRYMVEASRWRRRLAGLREFKTDPIVD